MQWNILKILLFIFVYIYVTVTQKENYTVTIFLIKAIHLKYSNIE